MAKDAETLPASRTVGRRVREERTERGWSQERLSDELRRAGMSIGQTDVARLESASRPRSVTVDDLYSLAAALDVPPLSLLLPTGSDHRVQVGPQGESADRLRAWITGVQPLNTTRDPERFLRFRRENRSSGAPGLGGFLDFLRDIAGQLDAEDAAGQEEVILSAIPYLQGSLRGVRFAAKRNREG